MLVTCHGQCADIKHTCSCFRRLLVTCHRHCAAIEHTCSWEWVTVSVLTLNIHVPVSEAMLGTGYGQCADIKHTCFCFRSHAGDVSPSLCCHSTYMFLFQKPCWERGTATVLTAGPEQGTCATLTASVPPVRPSTGADHIIFKGGFPNFF